MIRSCRALLYWMVKSSDHLLGVLAGRFHRRHARPVLPGGRLEEGAVDLHLHVAREEPGEDRHRIGLVDVVRGRPLAGGLAPPGGSMGRSRSAVTRWTAAERNSLNTSQTSSTSSPR